MGAFRHARAVPEVSLLENTHHLMTHFEAIGARLVVDFALPELDSVFGPSRTTLDIRRDKYGQYFYIHFNPILTSEALVLNCKPLQRHLLLMFRESTESGARVLHRFLCGHDEREWFAAAIPSDARISTVAQAMEALKPEEARQSQVRRGVRRKHINKRHNAGFLRQGEWFFMPVEKIEAGELPILLNEPLSRGGGKPHMAEELVRTGGVQVYQRWPGGKIYGEEEYRKLLRQHPHRWRWVPGREDMEVHVRGRITHPDHKTLVLNHWHRVLPNTEHRSAARANLRFID